MCDHAAIQRFSSNKSSGESANANGVDGFRKSASYLVRGICLWS